MDAIKRLDNLNLEGIKYGFITKNIPNCTYAFSNKKNSDANVRKNNLALIAEITNTNESKWSFVEQIHSDICISIEKSNDYLNLPNADAQITNHPGNILAIQTADCLPILLYCPKQHTIASVHAGWKGAKSGIIENTLQLLSKNFRVNPSDLVAIFGPNIKQNSYEVGPEFYDNFINDTQNNQKYFIPKSEKFLFDLESYATDKLEKLGITQIHSIKEDTYTNQQDWFSYRKYTQKLTDQIGSIISYISLE